MTQTTPASLRLAALALAAAALPACSFIPAFQRPPLPVPEQFPQAQPGAAGTQQPVSLDWPAYFSEPQLRELIATALLHNRDLRVALLNIEQARAQFAVREADRLPTVGLGANLNRGRGNNGSPVTTYSAGLLVSNWETDFFGRISALGEQARAQYLATREAAKSTQVMLVGSVATAWLNLLADQELVALARQTLQTREESLRLTRLRFENGVNSEVDLQQAQSLSETARVVLAQAERQRLVDLHTLDLLLGQALPESYRADTALAKVSLPDVPAGLPSEVLTQRPDVRQAEMQLLAANANIGAARAAFFPNITLTAGLGSASTQLSRLFQGGTWAFTAAPQILETIFDSGRREANLRAAKVSHEIAVAQYQKAVQTAFREVADALTSRAWLREQLQAQQRVTDAESQRLKLAQMRYDAGVTSNLELLDAQRSYFAAQQAIIQTRLQLLLNQVGVYRSLGGGWSQLPQAPV